MRERKRKKTHPIISVGSKNAFLLPMSLLIEKKLVSCSGIQITLQCLLRSSTERSRG